MPTTAVLLFLIAESIDHVALTVYERIATITASHPGHDVDLRSGDSLE